MPISYIVNQDILSTNAQWIVNTVNCVGVMGKGLALQVKQSYPDCFPSYQESCKRQQLKPGMLKPWFNLQEEGHHVLHFATKAHWKDPSQLEWINEGLKRFVANYERLGITSVAFPPLGCGNGGLEWDVVRLYMTHYLATLPIDVRFYIKSGQKQF